MVRRLRRAPRNEAAAEIASQLREAEESYRSLVEHLPTVTYVMDTGVDDAGGTLVYISPQVEALLGHAPEAFVEDPELWVRILDPEDRARVLEAWARANRTGESFVLRYRYRTPEGRAVWVRDSGVLVRDAEGHPAYWQGALIDISDRVHADEEVRRRDAILAAVALAAERFLAGSPWVEEIDGVLARLGAASGASRVYVFQNRRTDGGDLVADQRFEWVAPGISPQIDNPELQGFVYRGSALEDWAARMERGEPVQGRVSRLPRDKAAHIAEQAIRSLVLVPVFVDGSWWGFVGFDDCTEERTFSGVEVEALRAAAGILGGTIAREQAGAALREAERRYRTLIEQLPTVVHVSRLDESASSIYMSPQVEALLGYPPEEWLADDELWGRLLHPDDRDGVLAANEAFLDSGEPFAEEYRMIARDGREVWIREETVLVRDAEGRRRYAQGIMLDVTAQKTAEAELRESMERLRRADADRRRLLGHLVRAQEEERSRIAADIHDDPLQKVTAVGMRLGVLRRELADEAAREAVAGLEQTVERAVASLRDLLFEVRPPALDDRGLAAAVEEYLGEIARQEGIEVRLDDRLRDELPAETRVVCYRVAQEAIANVRKHARARRIDVFLRSQDDGVLVRVRDDGVGFEPRRVPERKHLGLPTMRERAELVGGRLRIDSGPGRGTTVELWVPSVGPAD